MCCIIEHCAVPRVGCIDNPGCMLFRAGVSRPAVSHHRARSAVPVRRTWANGPTSRSESPVARIPQRLLVPMGVLAGVLTLGGTAIASFNATLTVDDVEPLGSAPGLSWTIGYAANARGDVAGYGYRPLVPGNSYGYVPVRALGGGAPVPMTLPADAAHPVSKSVYALSSDIAETGAVAGYARRYVVSGTSYTSTTHAMLWDASGNHQLLPPADVMANGWSYSEATAISPSARYVTGKAWFNGPGYQPVRWAIGDPAPTRLTNGGASTAYVYDVNDDGIAVGEVLLSGRWRAGRWSADGQSVVPLGDLTPNGATSPAYSSSAAYGVLADGSAVGYQIVDPDGAGPLASRYYAVRWNANGEATDISPDGAATARAYGGNATGMALMQACFPGATCTYGVGFAGSFTPVTGGSLATVMQSLSPATGHTAFLAGHTFVSGQQQMARWPMALTNLNAAPVVAFAADTVHAQEGSGVLVMATVSDPDGPGPLTYAWDVTDDGVDDFTTITSTPSHAFVPRDDGVLTFRLRATDGAGATSDPASVTINVANVAPMITALELPGTPVTVNTEITATARYTDPGVDDTHAVRFTWDWNPEAGVAAADAVSTNEIGTEGSSLSGTTYGRAGIYTVRVTVTDDDGGTGERVSTADLPAYVVVYDPLAGFVTGGGSMQSPAGACQLARCTSTTAGPAEFSLVARYPKGATSPTGNLDFTFPAGNLAFQSTSYRWLVINGTHAQFSGEGTINGAGRFGFLATARDGQASGGERSDGLRIRIWAIDADGSAGAVVYDNGIGQLEDSHAATIPSGGNIVIHTK